jgi:hypothetical protein
VAADDFEAVFVTEAGVEQRVPWWRLPDVVDELGRGVRSSPSFVGRGFPGWYWASTSGGLVGFESWVARDHLVALDFDASVVGFVSQPFWLCWTAAGGRRRRHVPDFLVRRAGGAVMVLDSRSAQSIGERDREAFAVTGRACAAVGWRYALRLGRFRGVQVDRSTGPRPCEHAWEIGSTTHGRCVRNENPAPGRSHRNGSKWRR